MRRLGALLAAFALLATACSSGGGHTSSTSTKTSAPPALGKPNPLGAKWDWTRLDAFKPYLASLSGGATFYDFAWCDVEPTEGKRDWSAVDSVANDARALGFQLYLKIRTGACWATVDSSGDTGRRRRARKDVSSMPVDMAKYEAFVSDTVKHFSPLGVHEYAIENEVNAPLHWAGTSAEYVTLVTAAGRAIHDADAGARVVDGGLGSTVYGDAIARRLLDQGKDSDAVSAYQRYYARRFAVRAQQLPEASDPSELRNVLSSGQAVRNLEYFDATMRLAQDKVVDDFQVHFYERYDNVAALVDLLHASLPSALPIQAWEVGEFWPDAPSDEATHANELQKAVNALLDGGVQRVIWLPLAYNPSGRNANELRFGLVDPDGHVRQSGTVFAQIAAAHARA
ncbi:MAG: hypothetical protein JO086_17660 [Acidimicrobiia bacterium]|nr:hypothetical protein [Acidimicrobiia bacterium]